MQNTEGVCANMKQACVFTARGADRSDDVGGHAPPFIFLRDTLVFPEREDVWFRGRKAGGLLWLKRRVQVRGGDPEHRDPKLPLC